MFTTLQDIYHMVWEHPMVFMPIFSALEVMKSKVCGEYFWNKLGFDRQNDFKDQDIQDILSQRFDKTVSSINFLTSVYAQIPPPATYKIRFDEVKVHNRSHGRIPTKVLTDQYIEKSRGIAYEIKKRVSISLNVGAAQTLKAKAIKAKKSNKQQEHSQQHENQHHSSPGSSAAANSGGSGIRGVVRRLSNAAVNALKFRSAKDTKQSKQSNYAAPTTEEDDDDDGEGDVDVEDELYGGDPDNHHQDSDKKKVKNAFYQKEKRLKQSSSGVQEKSEKDKDKDAAPPKKASRNMIMYIVHLCGAAF